VTLVAALARRVASPSTTFNYPLSPPNREQPQPWHANRFVSCHNHTVTRFDLTRAYGYSCNVAFAELGLQIGAQAYQEAMRAFGLGEQPPLEVPAEASQPARRPDFFSGDEASFALASTAMGQGELAITPLQMALVVAAIANDGAMPAPYVMAEARGPDGNVVWRHSPSIWKRPMDRGTAETAKAILVASVEEGWARAAKIPGVMMGGKTGTAELGGDTETHAWFVGYAPAENPQFAIAVIKERAGFGSAQAAPVARSILATALGR
jgi:peptidoglycan glycosyltransferase